MLIEIDQSNISNAIELVEGAGLPCEDMKSCDWMCFLGWSVDHKVVGVGGMEQCGPQLLLRSVVVAEAERGHGIAAEIVGSLLQRAAQAGYQKMYLLTLDAQGYFADRFGFTEISRDQGPAAIKQTKQFKGLCPGSATLMERSLDPSV